MTRKRSLTIVQMNGTHACFDIHLEMFWQGDHAEYRQAGGYAEWLAIWCTNSSGKHYAE